VFGEPGIGNNSIPAESAQLHPLPRRFEQLAQPATEDMSSAPCEPRS
jgi:hypothetical protein